MAPQPTEVPVVELGVVAAPIGVRALGAINPIEARHPDPALIAHPEEVQVLGVAEAIEAPAAAPEVRAEAIEVPVEAGPTAVPVDLQEAAGAEEEGDNPIIL